MSKAPVLAALALVGSLVADAHAPLREVHAGTALRLTTADLVDRADLVLEARVLSTRGLRAADGRIETELVLSVDRTLWGTHEGSRTVRLPGGVLPDGRGLVLPGMPTVRAGEDVLLFLTEPSPSGVRMPVGLAQGKFRVVTDRFGFRALVRDQADLELVDPRSGQVRPAGVLFRASYAETMAEVHAAVSRKARRLEEAARHAAGGDGR